MQYTDYLKKKEYTDIESGFMFDGAMPEAIFEYQADIVKWALRRGRAAIFLDTGLGKTIIQLAWAQEVANHTNEPVLILAPLAVSEQTIREGEKFGIHVERVVSDVFGPHVYITNYEQLKNIDASQFSGVVLDESSILKGMNGAVRKQITESFIKTPYKLSCTATPSPNDHMELGTQSEFLGIMSQIEMLAMFFIHDGSETAKWRLKGHGIKKFWEWVSTWAVCISSPADFGYDHNNDLPPIHYHSHVIETGDNDGFFVKIAEGLQERNQARRESVVDRCNKAAEIANSIDGPVLVWCHLNDESAILTNLIDGAYEVKGADKPEIKAERMIGFSNQEIRCLVTKPKIAGFGMNWQHCNNIVFVGLSDSWEQYYQAIRRCWRFGQEKEVNVHIVSADTEGAVVLNIQRKEKQNFEMRHRMLGLMRDKVMTTLKGAVVEKTEYKPEVKIQIPSFI